MNESFKDMDTKELQLPETTFSRDIENKVFQAIVFQCLSRIDGIALVSKSLIDSLLGRDSENYSAIIVEQNDKQHSVAIKVEINIKYGISIPEKAEEIQSKIIEAISKFTGLHVNCVHVVFKNLIVEPREKNLIAMREEIKALSSNDEYEGF
jgi:uncharacterized alkaline shock family protein YloU